VEATLKVTLQRENDGRWIAEVIELPGVLAYGQSMDEAIERVKVLAVEVITDRLGHGESPF
jgi:predicted RNase H-like HicB family nuclease